MALLNSMLKSVLPQTLRRFGPLNTIHTSKVDYLYAPSALGIDSYLYARNRIKEQFADHSDKFRAKMTEFANQDKGMIFTEDLKNMVHMAEVKDLDLITTMVKKFNAQISEYRFGSFIFGPVVMRMFSFLNAPNEALTCFNDPVNDGFFDQQITYQLLLDLLYENQMYDEMYDVFDKVQKKQLNMTKFPKYSVVLILAACYKQNTPKSFEYASKLWSELINTGTLPLRRACALMAALALKQNAPHVALEVISQQKQHYVTIRNIKAQALAAMGRVDDALPVLRSVLEIDSPTEKDRHNFFAETISVVRQSAEKSKNSDLIKEFETIEKALNERSLIKDQSLDELLTSEIKTKTQNSRDGPQQYKRMPFGQRRKNLG